MTTTHQAPSEKAFTYALALRQQLSELKGVSSFMAAKLLEVLAGMNAAQVSQSIDYYQQEIKSLGAKTATFTPAPLAYVPPAGQYVVDGEHLTLKVSKAHGGTLVYEKYAGYLGALASSKLAKIAEALSTPAKAKAAVLAYSAATHKCGICNTKLTDPKSIEAGIGPVCAKKFS